MRRVILPGMQRPDTQLKQMWLRRAQDFAQEWADEWNIYFEK